jgi:hypothetical protein
MPVGGGLASTITLLLVVGAGEALGPRLGASFVEDLSVQA